ncbi:MAG: hypothetical protein ABSH50_00395 [Bryobacteraceae bacterium]|jgi:hypothetical protein
MRFRFHYELSASSRLLAWAWLAAACFPGIAAATDTATPSQPYLAFNAAEVGISPTNSHATHGQLPDPIANQLTD